MKSFAGKERSRKVKVAFTTSGNDLSATLDNRFGRAERFLIYNLDTNNFTVIDNRQNLNAAQGAGIQSAETVARSGAKSLVTGHCGPKAFRVLSAAGIKVYTTDAATVEEALERFRTGKLAVTPSGDVEAHWA
jgi:predicted Fe-Mo cluster-binding NifX family protein